jgi:DNA gyrase subunit A
MDKINKREIVSELQDSYLDYAMSVIVSRALPDVRDGLKPVHRRIFWGMWDSGSTADSKFKKSANIVGEVMGKYHPHGDVAIYDTLVRMAQDFSMRYPLIQGQGNFGSIDGDSAAAMRYTETRLARVAHELLFDIEKETVDWMPNYDGTRQEPKVVPAKLPNLLLNGSLGIAVGMTTNIPPHNLTEIVEAVLYLADNPEASGEDLLKFIKGPDFPTGGIIFDKNAIRDAYLTGRGSVTTRAKTEILEKKSRSFEILITEIPFQVNKSELIKKMAELVGDKKIEGIKDIRDESGREGLRIVIELKNDVPPQKILNQLYKFTDLQKNFNYNMIALVDGIQPRLLSLKEILGYYVDYRKIVIRRRTEFDLRKAEERAHILTGLAKALDAIDKVIATIKKSKSRDDARENLMKIFKFSELQAVAILEMRLQALAALEREKIENELKEKLALIKELSLILKTPSRIVKIIKDELEEIKSKYGDERRTKVVATGLTNFSEEDLVPQEEVVITLSSGGYIKRISPSVFKSQHRGGKGLIGSELGDDDFITHFIGANTHDNLLFFTDRGRVFQTKAYEIPVASRTSKGKAIHNFLELPTTENVSAIISYSEADKGTGGAFLVMATKHGLIKKTKLDDFKNIRRSGIIAIDLKKEDNLGWVRLSNGSDQVVIVTKDGQSIRFKESQIRAMGRGAAGVKAIRLKKGDFVSGFDIIKGDASPEGKEKMKEARLLVVMAHGFSKRTKLGEYKVQSRGGGGIRTAVVTAKTGEVIGAEIIFEEGEILALSAKGQIIRTDLKSVRETGRSAQGVRIMNLKPGDRLAGFVVI